MKLLIKALIIRSHDLPTLREALTGSVQTSNNDRIVLRNGQVLKVEHMIKWMNMIYDHLYDETK